MIMFFSKNSLLFNYIICIIFCAFTRYILQIITDYIFQDPQPSMDWVYFINFIFCFLLFLSGCLVGYLVNKRTILHASLATAIAAIFSIFILGVKLSDYVGFFSLFIVGAVLGGVGGATVLLIKKLCQSHKKTQL